MIWNHPIETTMYKYLFGVLRHDLTGWSLFPWFPTCFWGRSLRTNRRPRWSVGSGAHQKTGLQLSHAIWGKGCCFFSVSLDDKREGLCNPNKTTGFCLVKCSGELSGNGYLVHLCLFLVVFLGGGCGNSFAILLSDYNHLYYKVPQLSKHWFITWTPGSSTWQVILFQWS